MERAQCIAMLYPELEDRLVVTIMGASAQELYDLGHRENFFYLQHAMAWPLPSDWGSRSIALRSGSSYSTVTARC